MAPTNAFNFLEDKFGMNLMDLLQEDDDDDDDEEDLEKKKAAKKAAAGSGGQVVQKKKKKKQNQQDLEAVKEKSRNAGNIIKKDFKNVTVGKVFKKKEI